MEPPHSTASQLHVDVFVHPYTSSLQRGNFGLRHIQQQLTKTADRMRLIGRCWVPSYFSVAAWMGPGAAARLVHYEKWHVLHGDA